MRYRKRSKILLFAALYSELGDNDEAFSGWSRLTLPFTCARGLKTAAAVRQIKYDLRFINFVVAWTTAGSKNRDREVKSFTPQVA